MTKKSLLMFSILLGSSLYALEDYRCTDTSLCEIDSHIEASSLSEAFSKGRISGQIRLAYINQDYHVTKNPADPDTVDDYATSLGGQLKFETAKLHHFSLGIAAYISQKVHDLSGDKSKGELNGDFFDENRDSFTYIGEAYIDYEYEHLSLRYGRQTLDTPLNDRDDIRMLPNTFEAVMLGYGGIEDTILIAGYISRWAGYDSGDDISKFKEIPGGTDADGNVLKGVYLAGIMNESLDDIELQVWYYDFDETAGIIYLDGMYGSEYESGLSAELGLQFAHYDEKSSSNFDGKVYGAILGVGYEVLSFSAAYNSIDSSTGNSIILGFGGGPYFTSMEEWTIDGINDGNAYVFGIELDLAKLVNSLSLFYAHGRFEDENIQKVKEDDIILSYELNDATDLEISYANVNDESNSGVNDIGYDRLLVRANYNF